LTDASAVSLSELHHAKHMTNNTTARTLAHAILARRKKATVLRLRLAKAKAESMEAIYGLALARPFWQAVGEAESALARLTA
jgi:hypothetical protein